ncbi:unnamed protein product [Candida verbasci]|uniref:Major facilitator superfamily (MFS) profile domain-containing protein n=1 Tax=Candida verbasci TaxID=1227364 RepID=A0A9W4TZR9_9ASCO|nr:unnamed protein product [Candida verbasci]
MSQSIHSIDSKLVHEHNKHIIKPPDFSLSSIKQYFVTRFTSLWVGTEELKQYSLSQVLNPFQPLVELNLHQWNFFAVSFLGWTLDAFDFFTTSLNVSNIAKDLNVSIYDITWGITLVLLLRTVGAVIFGLLGDNWGRKWPFIINLGILAVIQLGTGFVKTYKQFLAVRAIFGIAMGGIFGITCGDALGDAPKNARGVLSGIFQEGYALGYLFAVIFQRAIANTTKPGWRSLFWFSAGLSLLLMVWRATMSETDSYKRQKERMKENAAAKKNSKFAEFKSQYKKVIKTHWLIMIYLIIMMSFFNYSSHASQDINDKVTVINVCANLGALAGGIVISHASNFIGRRTAAICGNIIAGAFIYPWAFKPMWVTAFFMQFGIQGSWSIVPIHLSELSPASMRVFLSGVAYQLGNMASSASSTIEARIEQNLHIYGQTMSIFVGCVVACLFLTMLFGPENRGADLGMERDDELSVYDIDDEENDDKKEILNDTSCEKPEVEHKV